MKLRGGVIIFLIAAGALFFLFNRKGFPREDSSVPEQNNVAASVEEFPVNAEPPSPRLAAVSPESAKRAKDLQMLKEKWREIAPVKGLLTEHHRMLARESVELLLCGNEMIELLQFLENNKMIGAVTLIHEEISLLFRSERAREAREMLINLPDRQAKNGWNYRQKWSYDAGRGCPLEEFDVFREALANEESAQNALFGRNFELTAKDPAVAVSSTVRALERKIFSSEYEEGLKRQMSNLPEGVSFQD